MTEHEAWYKEELAGIRQRKITPRLIKATLSAQVITGVLLTVSGWLIVDFATGIKTDLKEVKMTMVNEEVSVAALSSEILTKVDSQDQRLAKLEDRVWSQQ